MAKFTITPLKLGSNTRDSSQIAYQYNPGVKMTSPVIGWYLTDGKQKILVDTGGDPPDGVRHMPYEQKPEELPDRALASIGVKAEEISTVLFTHLHWDHASNNHLFPNARFYVQKKELQFCVAPMFLQKGLYDLPVIFQTEYEILDGDVENLFDGISVILTPGHTDGSQTILVDTTEGIYGLVGDLVNGWFCWESSPKKANGLHTDLQTCYDSFAKVEKACDFILPGHDEKIFQKKMYP